MCVCVCTRVCACECIYIYKGFNISHSCTNSRQRRWGPYSMRMNNKSGRRQGHGRIPAVVRRVLYTKRPTAARPCVRIYSAFRTSRHATSPPDCSVTFRTLRPIQLNHPVCSKTVPGVAAALRFRFYARAK